MSLRMRDFAFRKRCMAPNSALNVSVGVIAAILVSAAAYQASEVFAPLALALFIIALVWPLQSWLQARMPTLLALAITMVVTVAVCVLLASTVIWSFGRVGRSLLSDYGRYQTLYNAAVAWLEGHGISIDRRMDAAFRRRLAPARGAANHRPGQHHLKLLVDRSRLRHPWVDGGRRRPLEGEGVRQARNCSCLFDRER